VLAIYRGGTTAVPLLSDASRVLAIYRGDTTAVPLLSDASKVPVYREAISRPS
jgi:hypothetical protein